jgi:hypothetical protein
MTKRIEELWRARMMLQMTMTRYQSTLMSFHSNYEIK